MITQSKNNYKKHKEDVYKVVEDKHGKDKADFFLDYYSNAYDEHNKAF